MEILLCYKILTKSYIRALIYDNNNYYLLYYNSYNDKMIGCLYNTKNDLFDDIDVQYFFDFISKIFKLYSIKEDISINEEFYKILQPVIKRHIRIEKINKFIDGNNFKRQLQ